MKLCSKFYADAKTVLIFVLALIVFDLYCFECSKRKFAGEANVYINIHILSIIWNNLLE